MENRLKSIALRIALLNVIFCVAVANARTIKLKVVLDPCGRAPKEMFIVMNRDEREQPPLKATDDTHRIWTGEWNDERKKGQFPERELTASVRLGGARTECKPANVDKDEHGVFIAVFRFDCDENAVRQVMVTTEVTTTTKKQIHSSYVRILQGDKDCRELGDFTESRTVRDIRFPGETLLLQLHSATPDENGPGLWVFDNGVKNAKAPSATVFDRAIRKKAKPCKDDPNWLCLFRDDLVSVLAAQRIRPDGRSTSNARDNNYATFERLGLARLKLRVE